MIFKLVKGCTGIFKKQMFTVHRSQFTQKGFTLLETLITLGIVGVLAMLVLPALNKSTPNQNRIMFRKSYNMLQQAVSNLINNDAIYPSTVTGPDSGGITIVPRGFNYTPDPSIAVTTYYTYNKFCNFFYDQLNTVSGSTASCPSSGNKADTAALIANTRITTSDGVDWYMYIPFADTTVTTGATTTNGEWPLSSTSYTTKIIVDINGRNRGTNCAADSSFSTYMPSGGVPAYSSCVSADPVNDPCRNNPDTFVIGVRYDGKILSGASATGGSDACAVNILSNPTQNRN